MSGRYRSKVSIKDDLLVAEVQRNETEPQWVAVLTDVHSEYQFARQFIAYSDTGEERDTGYTTIKDQLIVEIADGETRTYWRVEDQELMWLESATEAEQLLEETS